MGWVGSFSHSQVTSRKTDFGKKDEYVPPPPVENFGTIDAQSINSAMKNRDIQQMVMTLGTRTSKQIDEMLDSYTDLYNTSLINDLRTTFGQPQHRQLVEFLTDLIKAPNRTISQMPVSKNLATDEFRILQSYSVEHWDKENVMSRHS